jgi:hypothetical protein
MRRQELKIQSPANDILDSLSLLNFNGMNRL